MKSNVSDFLKLAERVYRDSSSMCLANVSDFRDLKTIRSRVKNEGISFLTISLPAFARDFEKSLAQGFIDSTSFLNFRKNGCIPAFLKGMTSLIFDVETGAIRDEDPSSIDKHSTIVDCVRQICLAFKKVEIPCSPAREAKALENFISIEQSFSNFELRPEQTEEFLSVCSVLWSDMLRMLSCNMFRPRHGPGATADHRSGNQKYVWRNWHERLEPYFPIIDNGYQISAVEDGMLEDVTFDTPELEQPVKVVLVPKTLKGPRVIAEEPCCMQYVQQGIRDVLYDLLENKNRFTSGHINFRDQTVNQSLALASSSDGRLATIDLSDASDRVPYDLALLMFQSNPEVMEAIDSCRSLRAVLPSGQVIGPLRKFASMGSALCFPVEAMYFYTCCVVSLLRSHKLPVTPRNVLNVSRDVYVYGDDILVPTDFASSVLDCLQEYNCKVNANKTFLSGNFRESCGVDAYRGVEVTPIYVGTTQPKNRQQVHELISWISLGNLFYQKGFWRSASHVFDCVEAVLGPLPYVSDTSSGLGRVSFLGYRSVQRWNDRLHRFEVKAYVVKQLYRTDTIEGHAALMKSFLSLSHPLIDEAERDPLHLERSARRGAVALQLR